MGVCLALAVVASAAAGVRQGAPAPLAGAVTLRCNPPLVTELDAVVPRQLLVIRAEQSRRLGGVLVWTNGVTGHYSFVGPKSIWWSRSVCRESTLPSTLPRASLVRIPEPSITCVVPGRRVLVHAERRDGVNSMSLRALPHGQLLLRVELAGETVRAFASRYAIRLCELDS